MRVVITGATGFIGGAMARRLAAEGADILALSHSGLHTARPADLPITWRNADITDPATLDGAFDGADWVVHAAGLLGRAGIPEETYRRVNAEGARHVFAAVAAARADGRMAESSRLLHLSSAGVLGPLPRHDQLAHVDEAAPLAPSNAYERSKALGEHFAREFALAGLPLVVARPEFVYGPGDIHVLGLFRTVQRGLFFYVGNGGNTCHPTYIDDLVEGLLLCLRLGAAGETYQITGPRPVTFRELAETIAAEVGARPPWLRVPPPVAWLGAAGLEVAGRLTGRPVPLSRTGVAFFSENRRSTYAKAQRDLGYTPLVDLPEGVGRSVAWYRGEGLL
ncbi:Dihydroflavonol-4-reductase [Candidatus Promineifilum breve]|uniref:Dihydroflavonol-4-reductase n=1 Tax=Candidatus Promineifilum breve TaxID=1806508 RepID=A0A170PGY3_9CHLR|nr:NAD-dependent epimerase/dehydratase family protein [Candidatus Promineifilum breve]CUS04013.2 Dihydroflavonol-4-reductase [Candidatus Promineifilum breve]